ncbi:hypothetical protein [Intestinimonas butyriciproducens]
MISFLPARIETVTPYSGSYDDVVTPESEIYTWVNAVRQQLQGDC